MEDGSGQSSRIVTSVTNGRVELEYRIFATNEQRRPEYIHLNRLRMIRYVFLRSAKLGRDLCQDMYLSTCVILCDKGSSNKMRCLCLIVIHMGYQS